MFTLVERTSGVIITGASFAGMVELADTSDLGSDELRSWRFESSYPHSNDLTCLGLHHISKR